MQYDVLFQLNEAYRHGVYAEETLTEEEMLSIEEWVEALIEEGYDLDQYSDEELYKAYLNEAKIDKYVDKHLKDKKLAAHLKAQRRRQSKQMPLPSWRMRRLEKITRGPSEEEERAYDRRSWSGPGRGKESSSYNEQLDLYDIVSEYLVSEGFCDSYEDADVIMANMSEEWRESIVEEVLDERLTGLRARRAITKFQHQNERPDLYKRPSANKNPRPNYTLGAVATHKEGSPNPYNPSTPEDYRDSGNRPTKRGGRGGKGEPKTGYYGVDRRDSDRGSGNAAKRRASRR